MSTLITDSIENLAGTRSTSSDNIIAGCAKAWVNFNGTGTVAIRASYNVSSITDNGAGAYVVNFTSALPNANYCLVALKVNVVTNNNSWVQTASYSTTSVAVNSIENGASTDSATVSCGIISN